MVTMISVRKSPVFIFVEYDGGITHDIVYFVVACCVDTVNYIHCLSRIGGNLTISWNYQHGCTPLALILT